MTMEIMSAIFLPFLIMSSNKGILLAMFFLYCLALLHYFFLLCYI